MDSSYLQERTIKAVQASYNHLYSFLRNFWHIINEDPFIDAPHIRYLCNHLEDYAKAIVLRTPIEDCIINVPPGSSKSTIASQMFPAWLWVRAPWAIIIGSSYSSILSLDHAAKSKKIISSEQYKNWFDPIFEAQFGSKMTMVKDLERNYQNVFGGARISTSTGGTITGKHGHVILRDDPMKPMEAASDAYRLRANRFNDETLSSRKKDKRFTPTITIMQRLHQDDTTGHDLAKGKKIRHICLPAEQSDKVKPLDANKLYVDGLLDPVRMPLKILDDERVVLGAYGYAGQFDQSPSPRGGGIIQPSWFPLYDISKQPNTPVRFYLDTAYTEKQENDQTAILAYKVFLGKIYILHCSAVRKRFPNLIDWLIEYCDLLGYSPLSEILIEPKASGISIVQQMQASTTMNVDYAPTPIGDKKVRVEAIGPILRAGRVLFPDVKGGWVSETMGEYEAFPNGVNDDRVDVLEGAVRCELVNNLSDLIVKTN